MSIADVNGRISDLQSRIEALTERLTPAAVPAYATGQSSAAGPDTPFDVVLGQQTGQVELRPNTGATTGKIGPEVEALIQKYSKLRNLDPHLVRAVIIAESDGDPTSVSNKGAKGLMQLMPDEVAGYGVQNPFDPEENIAGGTRQLAEKLKVFGGNVPLALAAYNAGTHRVQQYRGVPPFAETRNYVKRILGMLPNQR